MSSDSENQYGSLLEQFTRRPSPPAPRVRAPASLFSNGTAAPPAPPSQTEGVSQNGSDPATVASKVPFDFLATPRNVRETGLSDTMIEDHIIRTIYFANEMSAAELAGECGLPYSVLDVPLKGLTKDVYVEIKGQRGVGDAGYVYSLSSKGKARALECLQKTWYSGPLPVPLDRYVAAIKAQSVGNFVVTADNIRRAFSDLVIKDKMLDQLGPAVNSGTSLFLFGAPGNGKTAIAERLSQLLGDAIYIPRAVEVDGYVIKLFDMLCHQEAPDGQERARDARWVRIKRPVVMVGGELTMAGLDLLWNEVGRFYEAPLQMKASGGIFFIDDFGRQIIQPVDLLNRWIVPLEKRVDFLTLLTGKKISVPFDQLLVFSTNLNPEDLVDEAFLRRIKFKVNVEDPDLDQFTEIMQLVCRSRGVPFDEAGMRYMLDKWWKPTGRPLRMCHPRDVIDQLVAIAQYLMREPALTPDLLDRACHSYFIAQAA